MTSLCHICLVSSATVKNIFTVKPLSLEEPCLLDMKNECFNFKESKDDAHLKNICESCISDVRAAYRFKRNYERNIMHKEKEKEIDNLEAENWMSFIDNVKNEQEDLLEEDNTNAFQPKIEMDRNLRRTNTGHEPVTKSNKSVEKSKSSANVKFFKCAHCQKSYTRKPDLLNHLNGHTGEGLKNCFHCRNTPTSAANSREKTEVRSGVKFYNCTICHKSYIRKPDIEKHLLSHKEPRLFTCPHCQKTFTKSTNLRKHLKIHSRHRTLK